MTKYEIQSERYKSSEKVSRRWLGISAVHCFVLMTVSMIPIQVQKWIGQSLIDKITYIMISTCSSYKYFSFKMFNCLSNSDEEVLYFEQVIARTAFLCKISSFIIYFLQSIPP